MQLKQVLEDSFVTILSPSGHYAVNPSEEFIVLDSDPVSHPKMLQDSVFAKIRRSTFIVVANFDGYLGKAAILEMGYAIATGISIYTIELVEDPNLSPYCRLLSEVFPAINFSKSRQMESLQCKNTKIVST
jgi:nucleoside 2-deoxyribosyltransferase